jgi:tetratricopeptide (TPR) repeat protein
MDHPTMRFQTSCCRSALSAARSAVCIAICLAVLASPAVALDRNVPGDGYYDGLDLLYAGNYNDAVKVFEYELRHAIRTPDTRWIDSICYHAMLGEAYYNVRELDRALEHYNSAVRLYLAFPDWLMRINYTSYPIRPAGRVSTKVTPWGRSTRTSVVGEFGETMLSARQSLRQIENEDGGKALLKETSYRPINGLEIMRCLATAVRRRGEILGPVARYDSMSSSLLKTLAKRPAPPNHWTQGWIDLLIGLAYQSRGKEIDAKKFLTRSLIVGGEFDHPLTGVALVELGRLALEEDKLDAAAAMFAEATYQGFIYGEPTIIEEAFRYGHQTHLLSNAKGLYRPIPAAVTWSSRSRMRHYHTITALNLIAAENLAFMGQTSAASKSLAEARRSMARGEDTSRSYLGAQWNYLNAQILYQGGRTTAGTKALDTALALGRKGSMRLYHIRATQNLYRTGKLSSREALKLFDKVLDDPGGRQWVGDPFESLIYLMTPHEGPLDDWFDVALESNRNDPRLAIKIADLARRHHFYNSLPMGGRLLSLRWLLEAPSEAMGKTANLRRDALRDRYKKYTEISRAARTLQGRLLRGPKVNPLGPIHTRQSELLGELAKLATAQEQILREIALRREPSSYVFPPVWDAERIEKKLPDRTGVLLFHGTSRNFRVFLLANNGYGNWKIESPQLLRKKTIELLRAVGNHGHAAELNQKELADDKWKPVAKEIWELLTKGAKVDITKNFDELVIVPDGFLWHLPFEMLQIPDGNQTRSLVSKIRLRYVPTVSLAVSDRQGRKQLPNTAVVVGKMLPRDSEADVKEMYERLKKSMPGTQALEQPLPAPSPLYASLFDRLIVLDEIDTRGANAYNWSVMPMDKSRSLGSLGHWFPLPWRAPDQIILPGFHTAAETSLRGASPTSSGDEVFLSMCGLMSTGARTVLLSRWRTGGQSAGNLMHEFTQELTHTTAAEAWQRSIELSLDTDLDPAREPRIKNSTKAEGKIHADHPLFWAGYMLVDTGSPAKIPDKKPVDAIKIEIDRLLPKKK